MKQKSLFVDTHCHLENEAFDTDRENVINKARGMGISIISSGISKDSWSKNCDIADRYSNVYSAVGLDPTQVHDCKDVMEWIHTNHKRLIAIGETGIDHYVVRDHIERENQEICFRKMITLAMELDLPIQVHSRSAGRSALEILSSSDATSVHMHAFDGKANLARNASRNLGYYFSVPPSVVRSPQKQKLVKAIDIEYLLLETDSPVLGPDKSERNEPANIGIALKEVASILRREEEEVREIILENTLRLYSRIKSS